jgi:hypothetical protein
MLPPAACSDYNEADARGGLVNKRRVLLLGSLLGVALLLAVALFLEPTYVVRGLLRRETFYQGRSTSYWIHKIKAWDRPFNPDERRAPNTPPSLIGDVINALGFGGRTAAPPFEPELYEPLDPAAIPLLTELLREDDDQVCFLACNYLVGFGPKGQAASPALVPLLKHPSALRRRSAASALAAMEPGVKEVVPDLIEALRDEDAKVNYCAVTGLGKVGPDARAAVPALLELLRSDKAKEEGYMPGMTVGDAARWALKQIDPNAAAQATVP